MKFNCHKKLNYGKKNKNVSHYLYSDIDNMLNNINKNIIKENL